MKQQDFGLKQSMRRNRREVLGDEMSLVMLWAELVAPIAVRAPVAKTGHPPFDLEMMLHIHSLQQWFELSDMGAEEAMFEMGSYPAFCGQSGTDRIFDRVSILRFGKTPSPCHLLDEQDLSPRILQIINDKLSAQGLLVKPGTEVDATLVAAPSSTKNEDGGRDQQMHQVKKGNQWHFGMKAHIGADADAGLVHAVICTAANINDVTHEHALLQGDEQVVFADAGFQGAAKRLDATGVHRHVAMRPGKRKQQKHTPWGALTAQAEKL